MRTEIFQQWRAPPTTSRPAGTPGRGNRRPGSTAPPQDRPPAAAPSNILDREIADEPRSSIRSSSKKPAT